MSCPLPSEAEEVSLSVFFSLSSFISRKIPTRTNLKKKKKKKKKKKLGSSKYHTQIQRNCPCR